MNRYLDAFIKDVEKDLLAHKSVLKVFTSKSYTNSINKGVDAIFAGQGDLTSVTYSIAKQGVKVPYKGKMWDQDKLVRMHLRNNIKDAAIGSTLTRAAEIGSNLIAVSSHSTANIRPKCQHDQGKVYSTDNTSGQYIDFDGSTHPFYSWAQSSYGEADGLFGVNCRHQMTAFYAADIIK